MVEIGLECCGCGVCSLKCPVSAIVMQADNRGFNYPQINKNKCINCGICDKNCPLLNNKKNTSSTIFWAKNLDNTVRYNSSSGGMFYAFSQYIIKQKGVVYGAIYRNDFSVEIARVDKLEDIARIQGSKYVDSDALVSYTKVFKDLEQKRLVLYSALPCQIAALKRYLAKEYNNLYCLEIVCAGTSSPVLFESYIREAAQNHNAVKSINFRNKIRGWKDYSVEIVYQNDNHKYIPHQFDDYMRLYQSTLPYRESCFDCHFKNNHSESDITIGDAWGINPRKDDDSGTSILVVHTEKGRELIANIDKHIYKEPWVGPMQKSITQSFCIPPNYQQFKDEYTNNVSCKKLAIEYVPITENTIRTVKKRVFIKHILKKLHLYSFIKTIIYK